MEDEFVGSEHFGFSVVAQEGDGGLLHLEVAAVAVEEADEGKGPEGEGEDGGGEVPAGGIGGAGVGEAAVLELDAGDGDVVVVGVEPGGDERELGVVVGGGFADGEGVGGFGVLVGAAVEFGGEAHEFIVPVDELEEEDGADEGPVEVGAHGAEEAFGLGAPFLEFGEGGIGEGGFGLVGGGEGPGVEFEGFAFEFDEFGDGFLDEFADDGDGADDAAEDLVPALAGFAFGQPFADFSLQGKTAEASFVISTESGKRNYFRVNTKNLTQYAAPSEPVWVEI